MFSPPNKIPLRSAGALKNQAAKLLRDARTLDRRRYVKSLKVTICIPDFDGQLIDLDSKTITIVNDNVEAVLPYDEVTSIVRKGEQCHFEYLTQLREKIKCYQVSKGFYLTTKSDIIRQDPTPSNVEHSLSSIDDHLQNGTHSLSSLDDRKSSCKVEAAPIYSTEKPDCAPISQAPPSVHMSRPEEGSKQLIEIMASNAKTMESLVDLLHAYSDNHSRPTSHPGVAEGTLMSDNYRMYRNMRPGPSNCSCASFKSDIVPVHDSFEPRSSKLVPFSELGFQSNQDTLMNVDNDADPVRRPQPSHKRPSDILSFPPPTLSHENKLSKVLTPTQSHEYKLYETQASPLSHENKLPISAYMRSLSHENKLSKTEVSSLAHENKLTPIMRVKDNRVHTSRKSQFQAATEPDVKVVKSKPRKSRYSYDQLRERVIQGVQAAYEEFDIDPDATFEHYESLGVVGGRAKAPLEHELLIDSILARLRKPPE